MHLLLQIRLLFFRRNHRPPNLPEKRRTGNWLRRMVIARSCGATALSAVSTCKFMTELARPYGGGYMVNVEKKRPRKKLRGRFGLKENNKNTTLWPWYWGGRL